MISWPYRYTEIFTDKRETDGLTDYLQTKRVTKGLTELQTKRLTDLHTQRQRYSPIIKFA
jgi:hypothetical protein